MITIRPQPFSIESLFEDWTGRPPQITKNLKANFPGANLPEVVYPRGGVSRIFYDSDKFIPGEGMPPSAEKYSHCCLIEETGRGRRVNPGPFATFKNMIGIGTQTASSPCLCAHIEHDEMPGRLTTLYDSTDRGEIDWLDQEPLKIVWPKTGAFLGYCKRIDIALGDPPETVEELQFGARSAWLIGLDEKTAAVVRKGKAYVIRGASFRITARGLIG